MQWVSWVVRSRGHSAGRRRPDSGGLALLAGKPVRLSGRPARLIISWFIRRGLRCNIPSCAAAQPPVFKNAGQNRQDDDRQNDQGEILLDEGQVAEEIAAVEK